MRLINIFSYFSTKTYFFGTHWGTSNEYIQHMYLWRNKKNYPQINSKDCFLTISLGVHFIMNIFIWSFSAPNVAGTKIQFYTVRPEFYRVRPTQPASITFGSSFRGFGCDVCGKQFRFKSSLEKHSVCHSKERKFVCSYCRKTFNRKDSLMRHFRTYCKKTDVAK